MSKPKRPQKRGFKQRKRKYCSCGLAFYDKSAKVNKAMLHKHIEETGHFQVPFAQWVSTHLSNQI